VDDLVRVNGQGLKYYATLWIEPRRHW